jgi:L-histidine N-alpha-methyltransferase
LSDNLGMSSTANVTIHASQFPEAVQRDLLASLRTRQVNHKFHYDSAKQTLKWFALHQAFAPSRNDAECAAIYDRGFGAAAKLVKAGRTHVIGLGCGGGQKDTRLLRLLRGVGKGVFYTPCDVSVVMVLVARQAALSVVADKDCFPLVCDLATANDLPAVLATRHPSPLMRLITFFGMIPNFEPAIILPKLAGLVRAEDLLLFSANLAPGADYAAGVDRILPQYDNSLTRHWLLTFLLDLGVERGDGEMRFSVEESAGLKKVVARFHFARGRTIQVEDESFPFQPGEVMQLFFSYRYTPELISEHLARHGLEVREQWVTPSTEEGVFICQRAGTQPPSRIR